MSKLIMPTFHFHISRSARTRYNVDDSLFTLRGTVVFANFYSARLLAQQINQARGADGAVQAGELNALGLIHEILHAILQQYRQQRGDIMAQAVEAVYQSVGEQAVETTLQRFIDVFPPLPVYRGQQTIEQYLNGTTDSVSNREIALEEIMLVWLQNQNPAASPFKELFDDAALTQSTAYPRIIANLREFFAGQEPVGSSGQTLFEALRAPFLNAPDSLSAQLDFMLYRWSALAGRFDMSRFFSRVVGGIQFIQEEQKFLWTQENRQFGGGGGFTATTPPVPVFRRELQRRVDEATGKEVWFEPEPEQFSPDLDWMPNLVLIAKSTYVWLDQLSKKYQREIKQLDQIPDEELDEMRQRGITGLWFIGVWERSQASAKIKHLMGNTDAIASAYSLYDYEIASELGGKEALEQLKARAWRRGVRLASDMVPNHMGIDSRWVMEHPEWFISSAVPPYPAYSFTGPDLSGDGRVTIQIEDHYFDKTDAAVVLKRTDNASGEARYLYHGNDGTSFPWNDTAQLDYLKPQVREQVIQTILNVARMTPVIRFDAAMTLAKKHYQRLWYPQPGEQNTIPSRGESGMTRAEFDAAMPEEFWREVVDRVAAEAPDTLLLAEAFWLMEGYFVRTLGMHRVYNSAFMHMLRDERNLEYRLVIKNTIEFDPEVLKRYVNFMNNPDERTAVDQFGKGDKYFGVAVLMATLPGLPMFGHGQIEGFTERYGMEFRAAMLDETPDHWLVERHEREIFPLLHKRYLFAGVENFLLYDVYKGDGTVEENVYAYSNRTGNEAALVAFNNSYTEARGTVRLSAASRDKSRDQLVQRTLAEGLQLGAGENSFLILREAISGNEFLRSASDVIQKGLEITLGAYKYAVYLDFRQVTDTPEKSYSILHERLHGRGVPDIEQAMRDIQLAPLHAAFRDLMNGEMLRLLQGSPDIPADVRAKASAFAQVIQEFGVPAGDDTAFASSVVKNLAVAARMANPARAPFDLPERTPLQLQAVADDLQARPDDSTRTGLVAFAFLHALEAAAKDAPARTRGAQVAIWIDEWQLGRPLGDAMRAAGMDDTRIWQIIMLLKLALQNPEIESLESLVNDANVAQFLRVNTFEDVQWFNKEQFDALTDWLEVTGAYRILRNEKSTAKQRGALVREHARWTAWRGAGEKSEYRIDTLLEAVKAAEGKASGKKQKSRERTPLRSAEKVAAETLVKSNSKSIPKKTAAKKSNPAAKPIKKTAVKKATALKSAVSKPAGKKPGVKNVKTTPKSPKGTNGQRRKK